MSGVLLAIVALFGWGTADFLAQRAVRKVGNATTLFSGSLLGLVILTPFLGSRIGVLVARPSLILLLAIAAAIGIFTALFSLEAYRRGKIAVVEPIMGLELPITILLAVTLRGERLDAAHALTMAAVFVGILMTATGDSLNRRIGLKTIEKGAVFGLIGAIGLGASNFVSSVASQEATPIVAVWSGRLAFTAVFGAYLMVNGRLAAAMKATKEHPLLVFGSSALYLVAFMAYATSVTLIPISVATTISETYIVLTVLLGVFINKEKLAAHQVAGIVVTALAVGLLSASGS
ncbi:MAG TPA: DMT family transporter [Patescibacteria group bacterium]|nr:DMT family transporter [Patescibacteria group bacterium]